MLQNRRARPGRSKTMRLLVPVGYMPRSNFLPSRNEKTLWKTLSLLGNSTAVPTRTTSTVGVNDRWRWSTVTLVVCAKGGGLATSSQMTALCAGFPDAYAVPLSSPPKAGTESMHKIAIDGPVALIPPFYRPQPGLDSAPAPGVC